MVSKVFLLIATFRKEPHWKLAPHEANDIAHSFTRMVAKTFPATVARAIETFFGKWGSMIGFVLVMQMIVEPRVETSRLARGQGKPMLRAMNGGRPVAPAAPSPATEAPAPPSVAPALAADAIAVPEVTPGSFKDTIDGAPVERAEVPL